MIRYIIDNLYKKYQNRGGLVVGDNIRIILEIEGVKKES